MYFTVNCMGQDPSQEAKTTEKKLPCLLWKQGVHYRVHNSTPINTAPGPIQSARPNPIALAFLLTPRNRVLLEKLTGSQLVKNFPAFYRTRRFTTAFTRALSLSWTGSIQPMPLYPTSWRSILILSSHLSLGLPSGPLPSGFPTTCLLPHTCYMPHPFHSSRFDRPNTIWWRVNIIKLLIMKFSPLPCYLVPLRPKYSPQHPILKHPQPRHTSMSQENSNTQSQQACGRRPTC